MNNKRDLKGSGGFYGNVLPARLPGAAQYKHENPKFV